MADSAKEQAARNWFGYGRWEARHWFVGMEPGGDDDHASYESWLELGGEQLIDCKEHHQDSNRRAGRIVTRWHENADPPVQSTWGPLIRMQLAFNAPSTQTVGAYQRDSWGSKTGDTALLEISALHARGLDVEVERALYREERIAEIRRRLHEHKPDLVVFFGKTYRRAYEKIVGRFGPDLWRWTGETLCVLVQHPAFRYGPPEDWERLGTWASQMVTLGVDHELERPPLPAPSARAVDKSTRRRPDPGDESATIETESAANDPQNTLDLIKALVVGYGLNQQHFRQLHHFGKTASLREHIGYCESMQGKFRGGTNAAVAERLRVCLERLDAGESWELAISSALAAFPTNG